MKFVRFVVPLAVCALALTWPSAKTAPTVSVVKDDYDLVSHLMSRKAFDRLSARDRGYVVGMARDFKNGRDPYHLCFAPDAEIDQVAMEVLNSIITGSADYIAGSRWTNTASGAVGAQGSPITLTYSFVPDGTTINASGSLGGGASNLFAWLNGIYGSPTVWQAHFTSVFNNWSSLTGINYVYEPNDDGVTVGSTSGALGIRGDVRIGAVFLDGPSNVLAYNNFPNNGDMVIDSGDTFFNTTSNNSLRLRNVLAHEHGHGIGLSHVCPDNQTKLMEPFVSTAYNGVQHDDRRGGQRNYGDPLENNDTFATATNLGTPTATVQTIQNLSTDDNSDVDFFKVVSTGFGDQLTVVVRPTGSTYLAGAQIANCGSVATSVDSLNVSNLGVQILDQNGTTVIATANSQPVGAPETLSQIVLPSGPGNYYIRVFPDTTDDIQTYELDYSLTVNPLVPFTITFPDGNPSTGAYDKVNIVRIRAVNVASSADPTTAQLFTSIDNAPFTAQSLYSNQNGFFTALLPPVAAFSTLRWYVSIAPVGGGAPIFSPANAPTSTHVFTPTAVATFGDDFESDLGWTVTNNAALTDGVWVRGVPIGGGTRGDPVTDGDGSGQCYLTDNTAGNSDVDGGQTILTSPVFNLASTPEARMSWLMWYDNVFGSNPASDTFDIQITNNGSTWVTIEQYNQSVDLWVSRLIRVADFVTPTATVRIRFIAQDPNPGAVVEAGIDAFQVLSDPPVVRLGSLGEGNVGDTVGTSLNIFTINSQNGGENHRVDVGLGQNLLFFVQKPSTSAVLPVVQFALYGYFGVPTENDVTPLPFGIGVMALPPCPLDPGNPSLFVLTDNFFVPGCTGIVGSNGASWVGLFGGIGFPLQVTLQPVIVDLSAPSSLAVGNAIILNIQ